MWVQKLFVSRNKLKLGVKVWVIFCTLFVCVVVACASENQGAYTKQMGNATINWFNYTLTSAGKGALPQMEMKWDLAEKIAIRNALIKSRYNLLQAIRKIRIHKDLFLDQRLRNNADLKENILGEIHNSILLKRDLLNNKKIQVLSQISLDRELKKQIVPSGVWYAQGEAFSDSDKGGTRDKDQKSEYTGIIVDARNISAEPALIFRLVDKEDSILYGPKIVNRHVAYRDGMAIYVQNKTKALESKRIGSNPLLIRAIDIVKGAACDLVLPSGKAAQLRAINKNSQILSRARVAIVLSAKDNEKGLVEYNID